MPVYYGVAFLVVICPQFTSPYHTRFTTAFWYVISDFFSPSSLHPHHNGIRTVTYPDEDNSATLFNANHHHYHDVSQY
ncbi:hypothetical protein BDN72DRAFT_906114 [Pluteus cervinus]|uniref:Uncharacterized protein n=1 Tax=Pluteus cervinus TaxID=181527 RepID=A0ACD3A024_9AGAR|nr:hypothetical protein BDN72DRAFT_906114 [Pluteus cervinus]